MPEYHVDFGIEVTADTPAAAAQLAWERLAGHDRTLPVATVLHLETSEDGSPGDREDIDLQELHDAHSNEPITPAPHTML